MLYSDPQGRFEIIALVWKPGQRTPLHDHDNTWGVEGVALEQIKVTNFMRVDHHSGEVARLRENGTLLVNEQCTEQLLPPADCYIMETIGNQNAITIHVYGKQLRQYLIFEPSEEPGVYFARVHRVGFVS
ncbi:cysteine dioxygenase [Brevibacillus sp. NRS-1366]|uniref:cysteine dioxygenase family protein n=1 Tax=Brevibacillus sp. NRS-1366 TaxID=3233899 RepID=UPI003D210A70